MAQKGGLLATLAPPWLRPLAAKKNLPRPPAGRPGPRAQGTSVRRDGSSCDPGEEGEVVVAGPQLFKGYKDPTLDADAFDERGRFRTGDLAVMRHDGHVSVTGRVKDIIIRKGENISAKEIEDVLYALPKVAAVAVVGLPDLERGERVCAVVEAADGAEPLEADELVAGTLIRAARACNDNPDVPVRRALFTLGDRSAPPARGIAARGAGKTARRQIPRGKRAPPFFFRRSSAPRMRQNGKFSEFCR